jgi:hypothetical protein
MESSALTVIFVSSEDVRIRLLVAPELEPEMVIRGVPEPETLDPALPEATPNSQPVFAAFRFRNLSLAPVVEGASPNPVIVKLALRGIVFNAAGMFVLAA